MRSHPARIRIGAESGVNYSNRRFIIRILQILKKLSQFFYQKHSFVYNSSAAQRHHIRIVIALFKHTSHIQSAIKLQPLFHS